MKTFLKVFLILVLIGILGAGGFMLYMKYGPGRGERDPFSAIPPDAIYVLETSDLTKAWETLVDSKIWRYLQQSSYFKDLNADIEEINTYLNDNPALDMFLEGRRMLISTHMKGDNDYDFLFVIDVVKVEKLISVLTTALGNFEGYVMTQTKIEGYDVFQLEDIETKDVISICLMNNLLLASSSTPLIERVVANRDNHYWENDKNLQEVWNGVNKNKLFTVFFNYKMLNGFAKVYLDETSDIIDMLSQSLRYTAFNLFLDDDRLTFEGVTIVDSIPSYLQALAAVEPGKCRAHEIISDQAAMYLSIGFDDFFAFKKILEEQYASENQTDYEDYSEISAKITKFLKLDLNKTLFNWIGNEIAVVKLRPRAKAEVEDIVIALHANNIDTARAGMKEFVTRIRKRSPMKFEDKNYHNFVISKLEMKGFFKLFLGKLYQQLEIPYFTFIEDYVVFSNSERNLRDMIDDYIAGRTLGRNPKFLKFRDNFEQKSNMAIYLQMPKIYQNLYYFSTKESREDVHTNKDVILSFEFIGMQFASKGDGLLETVILAIHDSLAAVNDQLEIIEKSAEDDLLLSELDSASLSIDLAGLKRSELQQENLKVHYTDANGKPTTQLKAEGAMKGEKPIGLWRVYYPSGNLRAAINFDKGLANGQVIFFYDAEGQPRRAEFDAEDGQIQGAYRESYQNGTRKALLLMKDGRADGDAEFYHPNGNMMILGKYKKGQKSGSWKLFDENGVEIDKEKWKKGRQKGSPVVNPTDSVPA